MSHVRNRKVLNVKLRSTDDAKNFISFIYYFCWPECEFRWRATISINVSFREEKKWAVGLNCQESLKSCLYFVSIAISWNMTVMIGGCEEQAGSTFWGIGTSSQLELWQISGKELHCRYYCPSWNLRWHKVALAKRKFKLCLIISQNLNELSKSWHASDHRNANPVLLHFLVLPDLE